MTSRCPLGALRVLLAILPYCMSLSPVIVPMSSMLQMQMWRNATKCWSPKWLGEVLQVSKWM